MGKTDNKFGCRTCLKTYATKQARSRHEQTHKDLGPKLFKCETCDYETTRLDALQRHNKKPHKSKPTCPTCNVAFARNTHLERHLKTCQNTKTFICNLCQRSYKQKKSRDTHEKKRACLVEKKVIITSFPSNFNH